MSAKLLKVAWIRNEDVPAGQPAPGHLNCPCGNAPESCYDETQGDVRCACGRLYAWNGYILESEPQLPAFRVYYADGTSCVTSMAAGVTLEQARAYFVGKAFEQSDEAPKKTVVRVESEVRA